MFVQKRVFIINDAWNTLRDEYDKAEKLSCQPDITKFPKYRKDSIIDENQSVKWNREYVERAQALREEEIIRLNKVKNQAISEILVKIFKNIQEEVGHDISMDKARTIWNRAYEYGHSAGIHEIFIYLEEFIQFAIDILD